MHNSLESTKENTFGILKIQSLEDSILNHWEYISEPLKTNFNKQSYFTNLFQASFIANNTITNIINKV